MDLPSRGNCRSADKPKIDKVERPWSHPPHSELGKLCRSGSASCLGQQKALQKQFPFRVKWLLEHLFCCAVTIKPCLLSPVLLLHSCCPQGLQELAGGPQSSSES